MSQKLSDKQILQAIEDDMYGKIDVVYRHNTAVVNCITTDHSNERQHEFHFIYEFQGVRDTKNNLNLGFTNPDKVTFNKNKWKIKDQILIVPDTGEGRYERYHILRSCRHPGDELIQSYNSDPIF